MLPDPISGCCHILWCDMIWFNLGDVIINKCNWVIPYIIHTHTALIHATTHTATSSLSRLGRHCQLRQLRQHHPLLHLPHLPQCRRQTQRHPLLAQLTGSRHLSIQAGAGSTQQKHLSSQGVLSFKQSINPDLHVHDSRAVLRPC